MKIYCVEDGYLRKEEDSNNIYKKEIKKRKRFCSVFFQVALALLGRLSFFICSFFYSAAAFFISCSPCYTSAEPCAAVYSLEKQENEGKGFFQRERLLEL